MRIARWWRVAAALGALGTVAAGAPAAAAERAPGEVIVAYEPGAARQERAGVRQRAGARIVQALGVRGAQLLRLDEAARVDDVVAELRRDPAVRYAEPNFVYAAAQAPDDPRFGEQWGLRNTGRHVYGPAGVPGADIDALGAWALTSGSSGVTMAVIDSGVALGHPELTGALIPGWDFVDGDAVPADGNGHGTHVAGIIAARRGNGAGVAGVAPGVRVMPLRALDDQGSGTAVAISAAITHAASHGADVVNMSLGGPSESRLLVESMAAAPEVLFVVAAGNGGDNHDGDWYVGSYPCDSTFDNLICVAASDARDEPAAFSDRGKWSVDLAAPGYGILSTQPHVETLLRDDFETPDTGTWIASGQRNDWRRSPDFALVHGFGMGSTGAESGFPDSTMRSASTFDLGGPRRPCRLSADVDAAVSTTDSIDIRVERTTPGDWPQLSWRGPTHTRGLIQFDIDAPSSRLSWTFQGGPGPWQVKLDDIWLSCLRFDLAPDGYDFLSGTSMATPMVAGVAALRLSLRPGESPERVKAAILAGADRRPALAGTSLTGARLNARGALEADPPPPSRPPSGRIQTLVDEQDGVRSPVDVDGAGDGSLLIAENGPGVARVLRRTPDGRVVTVAGTGVPGFSGDGGPATAAQLSAVSAVEALADSGFLIVDLGAARVRRVFPDGRIGTVAGNGTQASTGDGGPARDASLYEPVGVAAMPDGGFVISFHGDVGVRRVWPDGTITTVVGPCDGTNPSCVSTPQSLITALPDGGWLLPDQWGRVLRMSAAGKLDVAVGGGTYGFGGDGGPVLAAAFGSFLDLTALPDGGLAIADLENHRIRRVMPDGRVWTVAGSAVAGYAGDGGPATSAWLDRPSAVTAVPGGLAFVDGYRRVRLAELAAGPGTPGPGTTPAPSAPTMPGRDARGPAGPRVSRSASRLSIRVRARSTQARLRVAIRGRLRASRGMARGRACRGSVAISVIRRGASLGARRLRVATDCRFAGTAAVPTSKLPAKARRLTVAARFGGNAVLEPARAIKRTHIARRR